MPICAAARFTMLSSELKPELTFGRVVHINLRSMLTFCSLCWSVTIRINPHSQLKLFVQTEFLSTAMMHLS